MISLDAKRLNRDPRRHFALRHAPFYRGVGMSRRHGDSAVATLAIWINILLRRLPCSCPALSRAVPGGTAIRQRPDHGYIDVLSLLRVVAPPCRSVDKAGRLSTVAI